MNHATFVRELKKETDQVNHERMREVLTKSINYYTDQGIPDGILNLVIAIEELNEAYKEVLLFKQNMGSYVALLEEFADCLIVIEYVKILSNIDESEYKSYLGSTIINETVFLDATINITRFIRKRQDEEIQDLIFAIANVESFIINFLKQNPETENGVEFDISSLHKGINVKINRLEFLLDEE